MTDFTMRYQAFCANLDTAIYSIRRRLESEKCLQAELGQNLIDAPDAIHKFAVAKDLFITAGVIEGLEFALSSLDDLISEDDDKSKAEGEGHATE